MRENRNYILDGHTPVLEEDLIKWFRWFESSVTQRQVGFTTFENREPWISLAEKELKKMQEFMPNWKTDTELIRVSTVFLGLDHQYFAGPPILFETMIFHGPLNEYQERYETWDEASKGHDIAVEKVRKALDERNFTIIQGGKRA